MQRLSLLGCEAPAPLAWQTRCRILCETLRALTYLHNGPHVLHLDVKPSNILLDERCHVMLAATGTATPPTIEQAHHAVAGGYLDPLVVSAGGGYSSLTDGYAVGVTILATLIGCCAGPEFRLCANTLRAHECPLAPGTWAEKIDTDKRGGIWSKAACSGLAAVAHGLMATEAKDRISLDVALGSLEEIAKEAADHEEVVVQVEVEDVEDDGGYEEEEKPLTEASDSDEAESTVARSRSTRRINHSELQQLQQLRPSFSES